tara:strand:- start:3226 stop:3831 length:606 start_codon:yes stop_codon:yes gene_type:complete
MSSRPKSSDYQPSEAEKINAAVAKADKDYFDQRYSPLLREMRDIAETENYGDFVAGRAQADTMQALTAKPSIAATRSVDAAADLASASMAQQQAAQAQGLQAKRERQVGVLGTARGQQADTTTGLANAARLANTTTLQQAKRRQMMREARQSAAFELGGAFVGAGLANKGRKNSEGFFDSGLPEGQGLTRLGNYFMTGKFG